MVVFGAKSSKIAHTKIVLGAIFNGFLFWVIKGSNQNV
jgi:hypothetical protein